MNIKQAVPVVVGVIAVVVGLFSCGGAKTASGAQSAPSTKAQTQVGEANRPTGQDLDNMIDRYEKLLEQCAVRKSDRCADVMFALGNLYYNQVKEQAQKNQSNPDYSKSLKMYWQLTREYPTYPKLDGAYHLMGMIYREQNKLDSAKIILEQLVRRFPNSPFVSDVDR